MLQCYNDTMFNLLHASNAFTTVFMAQILTLVIFSFTKFVYIKINFCQNLRPEMGIVARTESMHEEPTRQNAEPILK